MWENVIDFWYVKERTLRILYSPVSEDELYLAMMAPVADEEASAVPVRPEPWLACFPEFGAGIDTTWPARPLRYL